MKWLGVPLAVAVVSASVPVRAQTPGLAALSLEQLLDVEITSVSRKEETLLRTAAAVHVITEEDIRRSGATTLPDLFRMVPGFAVGQINANTWSVTARGFAGINANKLLVLIDGRSLYTALNGGVHWDAQLLPLDAIAQIEVIRGPGGSLWGTNAINGVINIITKDAARAQGAAVRVHAGRYEPGTVDMRYGGALGAAGHHVTLGRVVQRGAVAPTAGHANGDEVTAAYGRTRVDWSTGVDRFSVQADGLHNRGEQLQAPVQLTPPYQVPTAREAQMTAGSAVFSWTRSGSGVVESQVQGYYSGYRRTFLHETAHTIDIDARQRRRTASWNDLVVGLGYRSILSDTRDEPATRITPARMRDQIVTGFLHDAVSMGEAVSVSTGAKLEHNRVTGFEIQPSIRGLWSVTARQSLWGAVSRTVRPPNRYERGMTVITATRPGPGVTTAVTLHGSPLTSSEILTEYEAGYRAQRDTYSVDATTFIGSYVDLTSQLSGTPGFAELNGVRVFEVPLLKRNDALATARGAEVAATWRPAAWSHLAGSYSLYTIRYGITTGGSAQIVPINGPVPRQQLHVRGSFDLARRVEATALFYRVSAIDDLQIPAINRLDLRLAWAGRRVELGAGVQNLLHADAPEYADRTARVLPSPVRLNPYVEASWRWGL